MRNYVKIFILCTLFQTFLTLLFWAGGYNFDHRGDVLFIYVAISTAIWIGTYTYHRNDKDSDSEWEYRLSQLRYKIIVQWLEKNPNE